jgi:Protein of unknown function (DUF3048) N-terminal domain/Protein of unknown function (DUF3048) C-terminal domain
MPAPGGRVPARPALAVKIDNLAPARPQSGLSRADIMYEEPVEGGITRFIAVFQCQGAPVVGPVRSGRLIDPEILSQYGPHPLLAYSGAIAPAVAAIDSSSLIDVGVDRAPLSAYYRDANRPAPHNLYTSTAALWAAGAAEHAPAVAPPAVFSFGAVDPTATPAVAVNVNYQYSDVTWNWRPKDGVYFRSLADTGPATLTEGGQITTNNIIVMKVVMYPSQYVEDPVGSHENLLTLTGSGEVLVFRNGTMTAGHWSRPTLAGTTKFVDQKGNPIDMEPGQTWIELVPTTVGVTATP